MENVYKKIGKKYIPIGILEQSEIKTDGIYMVRHKPGTTETTNLSCLAKMYGIIKVGEIPNVDLHLVAGLEKHAETVLKTIVENENKSVQELARLIVKRLMEMKYE